MGKSFLLCLLALGPVLGADSAAASIDRYLNAPFASELSAAPGGGRLAWILDERGRIRRHINVFVNGERGAEATGVRSADRVEVLPAITGG